MFVRIMNDYEQIVESAMLHEGCHEIVSTLLAEERKVEHLRIENELENKNEVSGMILEFLLKFMKGIRKYVITSIGM